jgi:hypothetical protein
MKPFAKGAVVLGAIAAIVAPLALAGNTTSRTLEFVSVQQRFSSVPQMNRQDPPQVGSRLVFQDLAFNHGRQFGKPDGARIGRAEGVCTLITLTKKPQAQCLITAHVPDGQIVVAGEGDPGAKVTHYAVVGGLGAYADARGWVTGTALSDTKSLIVVHFAD